MIYVDTINGSQQTVFGASGTLVNGGKFKGNTSVVSIRHRRSSNILHLGPAKQTFITKTATFTAAANGTTVEELGRFLYRSPDELLSITNTSLTTGSMIPHVSGGYDIPIAEVESERVVLLSFHKQQVLTT